MVDTIGLLLAVVVTAGNLDDGTHAPEVLGELTPEKFPRLRKVYADNKYNNRTLEQWMSRNQVVYEIEINSKPEGEGFKPMRYAGWWSRRMLATGDVAG